MTVHNKEELKLDQEKRKRDLEKELKDGDDCWSQVEGEIVKALKNQEGLRIGEASVVSTRVHTVDPSYPDQVRVVPDDAGRVFYQRKNYGEIVHVDCFHEIARIDQKKLAKEILNYFEPIKTGLKLPHWFFDYIDIQTGVGGGRLTGSLDYGEKKTLRDAHLNHVHLAVLFHPNKNCFILPLIDALEKGIIKQGYSLKKVEKVLMSPSKGQDQEKAPFDLRDYATDADSKLKGDHKDKSESQKSTGESSDEGTDSSEDDTKDTQDTQDTQDIQDTQDTKDDEDSDNYSDSYYDNYQKRNLHVSMSQGNEKIKDKTLDVEEIRNECKDDPAKVQEFVEKLENGYPKNKLAKEYPRVFNDLDNLFRKKILQEKKDNVYLTEKGKNIVKYMQKHLKEIELSLKRLAQKLPKTQGSLPKKIKQKNDSLSKNFFGKGEVVSREGNELEGPIAVTETAVKGAIRSYYNGNSFSIQPEDIQVIKSRKYTSLDLCLLIDASGSMAGRRMKEVKFLAEHLLVTTRDKVAIISFQEDRVEIKVPFTRDKFEMKEGLTNLRAAGLTPMAYGIKEGKRYMEREGRKNSMLLLITDGLPTICGGGADPFAETLRAASEMPGSRFKFTCIGLEPNINFLKRLTYEAGGSLYVVEEFNRQSLLRVIKQERQEV